MALLKLKLKQQKDPSRHPERFIDCFEVVRRYGISRSTIYKLRGAKRLNGYRINGHKKVYYDVQELEALFKPTK